MHPQPKMSSALDIDIDGEPSTHEGAGRFQIVETKQPQHGSTEAVPTATMR